MAELSRIDVQLNPVLDVQTLNRMLSLLKQSLGKFGGDIQLIDPKQIEDDFKKIGDAADKAASSVGKKLDGKELTGFRQKLDGIKSGLLEISGLKTGDGAGGLLNLEAAERFEGFMSTLNDKTSEARDQMRLLAAQTGAEGAELARLESISQSVFTSGGFDSFAEAIKAVGTARQAIGDAFSDADLETFTAGAAGIAKVLDVEVNEVIRKSSSFIKAFELDGQKAYDLVALGAQKAGTSQEDFLDSIAEYSILAKEAGLAAEEWIALLVAGGEEAAFNTDKIADAVAETGKLLKAGDIKFDDISGLDANLKKTLEDSLKKATSGEISTSDFLTKSVQAINSANLTDAMESKLFAAISGTPAEDLGNDLYGRIFSADIDADSIAAQAAVAGEQIGEAVAPQSVFEELQLTFEATFGSLAGFIGPALGPATQFLSITNALGPAMQTLGLANAAKSAGQFGLSLLSKVVPGLVTTTAATGAQAVATGGATTATFALNAAMLANPAFLMVAGITAVVGALAFLAFSGESLEESMEDVNEAMTETEKVMQQTAASDKQAEHLRKTADEYDRLAASTNPDDQKAFAAASREMADAVPEARDNLAALNDEAERGSKSFQINTDEVRNYADAQSEMNKVAREGALAKLREELGDLVETTADAGEEVADLQADQQGYLELAARYDEAGMEGHADRMREKARDISIEAGELATQYNEGNSQLNKGVKYLVDQGVSVEALAKEWKVTTEEVEEMVKREEAAEKAARDAAEATDEIGAAAANATGEVQSLGAQFAALQSRARQALSDTTNNVAALVDASKTGAAKQFDALFRGIRVNTQSILDAQINIGREQDAEVRRREASSEEAAKLLSTEVKINRSTSRRTKAKKTAFDIATAEYDAAQKIFDLQERSTNIGLESLRLEQGREESIIDQLASEQVRLAFLEQREAALRDVLGIADDADLTVDNIEIDLKDSEKLEAREILETLQNDLDEQANAIQAVKLQAGIQIDEDAIASLEEQALGLQIQLGEATDADFIRFVGEDIDRLKSKLDTFAVGEQARYDGLYEAKVLTEEEYNTLSKQLADGTHQQQLELANAISQRRVTLRDKEWELEKRLLDRRAARETAILESVADEELAIRERVASAIEDINDRRFTADYDRDLAALEDRYDKELITTEKYEAEKTAIAESAERKRAALAARLRGDALEAERTVELDAIKLQQEQLIRERDALLAAGKIDDASALTDTIDELGEQIASKAAFLSGSLQEIGLELGDAAVTFFDFDSERAKEPWRNMFGIIGGGVERLIKAKATELALTFVSGVGGIPGALLSVATVPIIEALISRAVSPLLNSLLSFSVGGAIEGPTVFLAGDGAVSGGSNKEWIFRDDQLHSVIEMVVAGMSSPLIDELRGLRDDVTNLQFRLHVSGADLTTATSRSRTRQKRRIINRRQAYRDAA